MAAGGRMKYTGMRVVDNEKNTRWNLELVCMPTPYLQLSKYIKET